MSSFLDPEEIDLSKDMDDFTKLKDEEQLGTIKNVLALFAASDGIVNENLVERFCNEVQDPQTKFLRISNCDRKYCIRETDFM